ncbi:uncharacterized protein LOC120328733 [Styela clava]
MSLSPRSAALTTYALSSPIHQSWESALADVVGVLRIQYRSDDDVRLFLDSAEKVRHLQQSIAAKMEWNRRVIKEEMDSGIHSPPRARRIAKEVAIDFIRRYLDGEEEKLSMYRRLQDIQREKEDTLSTVLEYEREMKKVKDENAKLAISNQNLREENELMRTDKDELKLDSQKLKTENDQSRDENDRLRLENGKLREENKKVRQENQDLRNENGALRSENQKVRVENQKLRDECDDVRGENVKVRSENQSLRDENQEVRCENLKLRDNNASLRDENERLRSGNGTLMSDNRKLIQDNLELNSREDEMRMLVNIQQSILAGKAGASKEALRLQQKSHNDDVVDDSS